MPASEKKMKYITEYKAKNLKRIPLEVPLSKYDEIKETARSVNESVNGFIKKAIDSRIEAIRSGQERAED